MEFEFLLKFLGSFLLIGIVGFFMHLYDVLVGKPERLRSLLMKQGLRGPPRLPLLGNILEIKKSKDAADMASAATLCGPPATHNCASALFPFFEEWQKKYGEVFVFSMGNTQILHITEPDMVREITTCPSLDLGKPSFQAEDLGALLGQGILTSNGSYWTYQRKIIAREFNSSKVKGMMNIITESALTLVNAWKHIINEAKDGIVDINIDQHMRRFSGDVISKACFGSNYSKGEEIFFKLRALEEIASKKVWASGIPGMRYLPTKGNRKAWALEKDVRALILKLVKERKKVGYEKDLLQMVLEGAKNSELSSEMLDKFIVDNCKNIYLAGYKSTAVSASWCLMLLASNPLWQERVRSEVLEVCNGQIPDYDMIQKMKQLTMVINESLRLYPPVTIVIREAFKDMKFGNLDVPKGVNLWIYVLMLHTNPDIWGPDADQFKPDRFANGIAGACKYPHLYMPFGVGPRDCLGQNMAMIELKVLIALVLCNFSFTLSPSYIHSPMLTLIIEPRNAVNLYVKKL